MAEDYQVLEELGSGSFGKVYKAIQRSTGDIVAIKQIDLEDTSDELSDIQAEIGLLSTCSSQYITEYKTSFIKGVKLWIVMEYLGGGSCLDLLKSGNFDEAHIAIVCRELLLGLDYLHATGKIHRDIKAANTLLSQSGRVKLADFGVAAQLTNMKSQRNTFVGTPYWMAPEVIQEAGYDFKADIWSLGITALELAFGEPPNSGIHPMKVLFTIPKNPAPRLEGDKWSRDFKDFIAQCLVKDPDRRPTAKDLLRHRFVVRAGKVEAMRELVERKQMYDAQQETATLPKYYEETMVDLSPCLEEDEWIFTVKPSTPARHATKRRKMARIPSGEAGTCASMMERMDLNAAPLGSPTDSPAPETRRRQSTLRFSAMTAMRVPSGSTPTVHRVSNLAKQPLGIDMSFGNSPSTVRHFKRISSAERRAALSSNPPSTAVHPDPPNTSFQPNPQARTFRPSPPTSAHPLDLNDENEPPAQHPPMPVTKDALYGRRAYGKVLDSVFQEAYAQSGSPQQRDAIAKVGQAWANLDQLDPQGEFLLLKAMVDRLQGDSKLASALGIAVSPAPTPSRNNTRTSDVPNLGGVTLHGTGTTRLRSNTTSINTTSGTKPTPTNATPNLTPASTPHSTPTNTANGSPLKGSKLILAQNNPHLKTHRRRQSAFVGGEKLFGGEYGVDEKKLPGYVERGMEQQGLLGDILYGQWIQGLKSRWPLA
ncbi:Pkinase-domain-containing protein [Amniculicola lignicola CBS 123094]|uniref:non-specific serine/threonine protein kinase n=1 Tax=Amniculicola lignicola CBS 123094 TaxID=1392246 RepID=A0A6A5W519_9PLEO|nr:Pkinase-domain-containing protein [Amniculicola lignicola CBS 123094]